MFLIVILCQFFEAPGFVQNKCQNQFVPKRSLLLRKKINAIDKQHVDMVVRNIASATGSCTDDVRYVIDACLFALGFRPEENSNKICSVQYVNETVNKLLQDSDYKKLSNEEKDKILLSV